MKKVITITYRYFIALMISTVLSLSANAQGTGYISNVVASTPGACVQSTINGNNQFWDVAQGNSYIITLSNVTDCANGGNDATIEVIVKSSHTGNTCLTANLVSTGVYEFEFEMPAEACATLPILYCTDGCSPSTGLFAQDLLQDGLGHLRTTYFDGNCDRVDTDNDCENPCTFNTQIDGDIEICAGGSTQLCVNAGVSWEWSNGSDDACITVSDAGSFSVVVFDANGCSAEASVTVTLNTPPTVTISADGPTSVCPGNCVTLTASGADSYLWSPNGVTGASISACETANYSVVGTDLNGCTDASDEVPVLIFLPPNVEVTPSDPDPLCEGECVTLTASGADSYVWSTEETTSSIEVCEGGTYSVVGTDANGCTAASADVEVTVVPNPSCEIVEPNPLPVFGITGNKITANIVCPEGCNCTYAWSLSSSDNSWIMTAGQNSTELTYTCGNNGTVGNFTFTITCSETGCSSSCELTVTPTAIAQCSYTQGFYGNGGKTCDQLTAGQAIYKATNTICGNPTPTCNPITIGYGSKTITFGCAIADTACIRAKLPANGTAAVLANSSPITCATIPSSMLQNGKLRNVLAGQTLTLAINLRLDCGLGSVRITSPSFTTYTATACVNGNGVPGSAQTYSIPQSVINCLGANNTIADLFLLANKKLGGNGCTTVSHSDINAAVDAVNRGFDKCRVNSTNTIRVMGSGSNVSAGSANLRLSLFPNPTNSNATVEFISLDAGKAVIDIIGINGALVSHLFNSDVTANTTNQIHFDTNDLEPGTYFVRVITGSESAYTRLVVIR